MPFNVCHLVQKGTVNSKYATELSFPFNASEQLYLTVVLIAQELHGCCSWLLC